MAGVIRLNRMQITVAKNEEEEPVPEVWHSTFEAIVLQFVRGNYAISNQISGVAPVPSETTQQISKYIEDYGATLVPLPKEAWATSVSIWYGNHWSVLVDLFTEEEGASDLVLSTNVTETPRGYRFEIYMVYVP